MPRLLPIATAAAIALLSAGASAAPVNFNVTTNNFITGSGYGVDGPGVETLLDVVFSPLNQNYVFSLATVGSSNTFQYGTITLNETGAITANETDNLGVAATFTFTDPLSGVRAVTATGTATVGLVAGPGIDYSINWNPVVVSFTGGAFSIALNSLDFRQSGQSLAQNATITLLSVPEPASLALAGMALVGVAVVSRRRS